MKGGATCVQTLTRSRRPGKRQKELATCADILFDRAPVMMHMIDGGGKLVKVNHRWSQTLGYKRKEAEGRWSIEFLTEESRDRAILETLPLFWRVGSARSVGYRFAKKDRGVIDVQLDAELVTVAGRNHFSYAAIRDVDDRTQWEQASSNLATLVGLTKIQRQYERVLFPKTSESQVPAPIADASTRHSPQPAPGGDVLMGLLEVAGDISGHLKAFVGLHNQYMDAVVEQQGEMLTVMKGIERSLDDLADAAAAQADASL